MSKSFLFLSLIGLMLFVLAIAGQDRSPLASAANVTHEPEAEPAHSKHPNVTRAPASAPRTLDIEPVLAGGE